MHPLSFRLAPRVLAARPAVAAALLPMLRTPR